MRVGACWACGHLLIVQEVKPCLCGDCAKRVSILRIPKVWGPAEYKLVRKQESSA